MQRLNSIGGLDIAQQASQTPAYRQLMQNISPGQPMPVGMQKEHAAQNMEYVFTEMAEEQDRATKSQFKVFQFCHGVKNGTFDFDMVQNARRQHILPNIKDVEFIALSPGNSAVLVKNSNQVVDVLDGDTLDLAFNLKADLAKCLFLAQKLIFVGTW